MSLEDEIMAKLKTFARSKEGRALIEKETGVKVTKILDGTPKDENAKNTKEYGEKMKDILYEHMPKSKYSKLPIVRKDDIIVGKPYKAKDYYHLKISFRDGCLKRESLSPKSDGLDNIVLLFSTGYTAGKSVYGDWDVGNTTVYVHDSVIHRDPDDFLKKAVIEFNSMYGGLGVSAKLQEKYNRGGQE